MLLNKRSFSNCIVFLGVDVPLGIYQNPNREALRLFYTFKKIIITVAVAVVPPMSHLYGREALHPQLLSWPAMSLTGLVLSRLGHLIHSE